MMKRRLLATALCLIFCGASLAETPPPESAEALIGQMVSAGANEYADERHAVEIAGCQLTTYRWKKQADGSWVLWTSFKVPMLQVALGENPQEPGEFFVGVDSIEPEMALIFLEAVDGYELIHEKPFLRTPKGEFTPSQRGDGTTHYFETKDSGVIIQQGAGVVEKARLFSSAYRRYRERYCTFIG